MESILRKLKAVLNGLSDEELDEFSLWIDNDCPVELIALDENSVTLITDKDKLKINDVIW